MKSFTANARTAGVLFIVATVVNIAGTRLLTPVNDPARLAEVAANETQIALGVLLVLISAGASAGIAIALYPVLRRYSEGLALGAVGFRLIEAVFYTAPVMGQLALVTLSREFLNAGSPQSSYFQTLDTVLLAGYRLTGNVAAVLAFGVGALLYYLVFFRTRLVPRWLSAWGIASVVTLTTAIVFVTFGVIAPMSTPQIVLAVPIFFQELVLAVWLLVRGFNEESLLVAAASDSATGVNVSKLGRLAA